MTRPEIEARAEIDALAAGIITAHNATYHPGRPCDEDHWDDYTACSARELPEHCDQCSGKGWVRIAGHNTSAICGYETVTECMACNPDGAIPWRGQVTL